MFNFYSGKGRVYLRIRTQINKLKYQLDYHLGMSVDGFDQVKQRYANNLQSNIDLMKIETAAREIVDQYGIENLAPETFTRLVNERIIGGKNSFFSFAGGVRGLGQAITNIGASAPMPTKPTKPICQQNQTL